MSHASDEHCLEPIVPLGSFALMPNHRIVVARQAGANEHPRFVQQLPVLVEHFSARKHIARLTRFASHGTVTRRMDIDSRVGVAIGAAAASHCQIRQLPLGSKLPENLDFVERSLEALATVEDDHAWSIRIVLHGPNMARSSGCGAGSRNVRGEEYAHHGHRHPEHFHWPQSLCVNRGPRSSVLPPNDLAAQRPPHILAASMEAGASFLHCAAVRCICGSGVADLDLHMLAFDQCVPPVEVWM